MRPPADLPADGLFGRIANVLDLRRSRSFGRLSLRAAAWMFAGGTALGVLWLTGVWAVHPELSLSAALAIGAISATPSRLWLTPLLLIAVLVATVGLQAAHQPGYLAAAALAGACAAQAHPTRWTTHLHGALLGLAGAGLGGAVGAARADAPELAIVALIGAGAALSLLTPWLPARPYDVPSPWRVRRMLRPAYRPTALRAIALFRQTERAGWDEHTLRGLAEATRWIVDLKRDHQTFDHAIASVDAAGLRARLDAMERTVDDEAEVRDQARATRAHLRATLGHHRALLSERALVVARAEQAVAFMEEAAASSLLSEQLAESPPPPDLPDLLAQLREATTSARAARFAEQEVAQIAASRRAYSPQRASGS